MRTLVIRPGADAVVCPLRHRILTPTLRRLHRKPPAASRDIITDFVNGTDRIDLSAIDANSTTIGNNAFTFIGTGAFAGGGAADFQFQLTGHHTMTAADLML